MHVLIHMHHSLLCAGRQGQCCFEALLMAMLPLAAGAHHCRVWHVCLVGASQLLYPTRLARLPSLMVVTLCCGYLCQAHSAATAVLMQRAQPPVDHMLCTGALHSTHVQGDLLTGVSLCYECSACIAQYVNVYLYCLNLLAPCLLARRWPQRLHTRCYMWLQAAKRVQACTLVHTHARTGTRTHACTHAREKYTRTCTNTHTRTHALCIYWLSRCHRLLQTQCVASLLELCPSSTGRLYKSQQRLDFTLAVIVQDLFLL